MPPKHPTQMTKKELLEQIENDTSPASKDNAGLSIYETEYIKRKGEDGK